MPITLGKLSCGEDAEAEGKVAALLWCTNGLLCGCAAVFWLDASFFSKVQS